MFLRSLSLLAGALGALAAQEQLVQVTNFGDNPTGTTMYVYTPAHLANPLPLIVALHECTASGPEYFEGTQYANLADEYGYIVIYPTSPAGSGGCWDVHTNATLTHNAGGDSLGIASQTRYAIANYGIDPTLVYVTGTSSGAMMTSVLMGAYPDLFYAGSLFSGVPYGCFEGPNAWNEQCAMGEVIMTPQEWGDLVRSGYPGYTGPRPKVQFWHGTADTTLYPQNFWEEIKQWTNVFNVSQTPVSNITNDPLPGYSRASYGPNVQGILAQGVGHTVPEQAGDVLNWFGITGSTTTTSPMPPPPTSPISPTSPTTTPTSPPGGTAAHWGQCGGIGWTGPTVCAAPYTCQVSNPYYSQCL